jgi:O-antigen/teichoic acid export membrane protein
MTWWARVRSTAYGSLAGNVVARVVALNSLFVATLLVARDGGPAVVGIYALLRVLPALIGMVVSCGLPVAIAYFLAGPNRDDRRLPLTIIAMAAAGGAVGVVLWVVATPLFDDLLFPGVSTGLVALAGLLVLTRLVTITAKSCSQGSDDLPGANRVIVLEELMFLPAYGAVWAAGLRGYAAVVAALLLADVATSALGWARLARRSFFRSATRPSRELTRTIASYGARAQAGGLITQLNLRLDFILLSILAGPAVLGIYAIASKFAEIVKILGMALTYVLYPQFARDGREKAAARARRLLPRAALLTMGTALPLLIIAGFVIPALYGDAFEGAVTPARIILLALAFDGVAGVISAYLYGVGRPGLNSWAMALGLVATVALDLLLIPGFEATGAAVASAVAYATVTGALVVFFWRDRLAPRSRRVDETTLASANAP